MDATGQRLGRQVADGCRIGARPKNRLRRRCRAIAAALRSAQPALHVLRHRADPVGDVLDGNAQALPVTRSLRR